MPVILIATVVLTSVYNAEGVAAYFTMPEATSGFELFEAVLHKVMLAGFALLFVGLTIVSVWKKMSLIPVLGLLSCSYLLCESGASNWTRFLIWLGLGFVVYFLYGYRKSRLATP
jgi:hypothetical protein